MVNSKALELSGITREPPDLRPEEGVCPAGEIGQIPVTMTICGGRIVYQS